MPPVRPLARLRAVSLISACSLLLVADLARAEYRTLETSPQQDALLARALELAGPGKVVVLDLDSTLLDNRPRQVAILRAWAAREGRVELEALWPEQIQEWELEGAFRRAGVAPRRVRELERAARKAWRSEFWTDEALVFDLALPGAARFARELHARGATLAYVGRRATQEAGTRASLARLGFPLDERAQLVLDAVEGKAKGAADRAREASLKTVAGLGAVVAALENEGPKVDALRERWPEALVLHVRTDGPGVPRTQGPWTLGFLRTTDPVPAPDPDAGADVPGEDAALTLVSVPDGDTIVVRDAHDQKLVVRLIGIDTPEKDGLYGMSYMAGKRQRHVEAYGPHLVAMPGAFELGKQVLEELLHGRQVLLRYDEANARSGHRDTTSSRRVLAYVFARGADGALVDVNAELAQAGLTYDYAKRYPHRRGDEFRALIEEAQEARRGYWGPPYQPF